MSLSNGRDSHTHAMAQTKAQTKGLPLPPSQSDTSHRPKVKALANPMQRTGIADLMPLSVQLEISVSLPLRRARASELYSAVISLRQKHLLGKHLKCKCIASGVVFVSHFRYPLSALTPLK